MSLPLCIASNLLNIKIYLFEPNSIVGRTNKLILNDNVYLQFGSTNNDSQFFHSGGDLHLFNNVGNTFVKSSSTYNIQAGHIRFRNLANNEDMANFYQNGRVDLHFDNQERHRLVGLKKIGVVAEIWIHTDLNNLSDENDIVRLSDDYKRT